VTQRRNGQPGSSGIGTSLYVNEFHAERMADVVAVVDTTHDIGHGDTSSLDAAVRNAVAVTGAYLRFTDRVGVVGFGGFIRWLPPGAGTRHYYRVVETLMSSRLDTSVLDPDLARLPRQAMPSGALVYVFTPLLDPRVIESLRDLRERGHRVVVFDTLKILPKPEKDEPGPCRHAAVDGRARGADERAHRYRDRRRPRGWRRRRAAGHRCGDAAAAG